MSERNQKQCIVLLPSGPNYERLFHEILEPVFAHAGFAPNRLQPRPSSAIPIDLFVDQIEQADALFADVSENTTEIWIAAGCAAALGRPLCLISSTLSSDLPLGIQYLPLISYPANGFPSDYLQLQQAIAAHLSGTPSQPRTFPLEPETPIKHHNRHPTHRSTRPRDSFLNNPIIPRRLLSLRYRRPRRLPKRHMPVLRLKPKFTRVVQYPVKIQADRRPSLLRDLVFNRQVEVIRAVV